MRPCSWGTAAVLAQGAGWAAAGHSPVPLHQGVAGLCGFSATLAALGGQRGGCWVFFPPQPCLLFPVTFSHPLLHFFPCPTESPALGHGTARGAPFPAQPARPSLARAPGTVPTAVPVSPPCTALRTRARTAAGAPAATRFPQGIDDGWRSRRELSPAPCSWAHHWALAQDTLAAGMTPGVRGTCTQGVPAPWHPWPRDVAGHHQRLKVRLGLRASSGWVGWGEAPSTQGQRHQHRAGGLCGWVLPSADDNTEKGAWPAHKRVPCKVGDSMEKRDH